MQIIQTTHGPALLLGGGLYTEAMLRERLGPPTIQFAQPAAEERVNPPVAAFEFKRPEDTEGGLE